MILPYPIRLLAVCLAGFFWLHLAVGLAVAFSSRSAIRNAERMHPRSAASMLLVFRLLPAAWSLLILLVLCIPSFLWFEPTEAIEKVGFA